MFRFTSLMFNPPKTTIKNYRGSMQNYIANKNELADRNTLELLGKEIYPNIFDTSEGADSTTIKNFMNAANENKVKSISFLGCHLTEEAGNIIGEGLKDNNSLEELKVTSSHLGEKGMVDLLNHIKNNTSLKTLLARSYNMERLCWTQPALEALKNMIETNKNLIKIELPNNQINDPTHIEFLTRPYLEIRDRTLASITGFEIHLYHIPTFNRENAENGELLRESKIRYR